MNKRVSWIIAIVVVILALFYSIPFILSTSWGSRTLLSAVSANIPGRIEADSLTLRWFGRQRAENLRLYGEGSDPVFQVERIDTQLTLWNLLWGHLSFGKTAFTSPRLHLFMDQTGSNLKRALSKPRKPSTKPSHHKKRRPLPLSGDFTLTGGSFLAEGFNVDRGTITDIEASALLSLPFKGSVSLEGSCDSSAGKGAMQGSGEWIRPRRIKDPKKPSWEGQGKLIATALPTSVVEALIRFFSGREGLSEVFGKALNVTAEGTLKGGEGGANIHAYSDTLQCQVELALVDGMLTLLRPALLSLKLVPALVNPSLAASNIELISQGRLNVECEKYSAQYFALTTPQTVALSASATSLSFKHAGLDNLVVQKASVNVKQDAPSSPLIADGTINGPNFSASGALLYASKLLEAQGTTTELPLPWVDLFAPTPLTTYLGSTLSFQGSWGGSELIIAAKSPMLDLPTTTFVVSDVIALPRPASFTYFLTPALFPPLAKSAPIAAAAESFSCPVAFLKGAPFNPHSTQFTGQVKADKVEFVEVPLLGPASLQNVLVALEGASLADGHFEITSSLFPTEALPFISPALPVIVNGLFTLNEKGRLTLPRFRIGFQGKHLQGLFVATYTYPNTIGLLFPGDLHLVLSPDWIPELARPTELGVHLNASEVIFSKTDPDKALFSGELTLPALELKGGQGLKDLEGRFYLSGAQDRGHLDLKADTLSPDVPKTQTLKARLELHGILAKKGGVRGDGFLQADALPTAIVSIFTKSLPLPQLVGPLLKVDGRARFDKLTPFTGDIDVRCESERLSADVGLRLTDTFSLLTKARPAALSWTATPQGFDALYKLFRKTPPLTLNQPATIAAKVSALNLPRTKFDPQESTLVASASSTSLDLTRDGKRALLENLGLTIDAKNLAKGIYAVLKGALTTDTQGDFELEGSGKNLFSKAGEFDGKGASFDLKGKIRNLRTPYLFDLLPLKDKTVGFLNALFGQRVSGNLQAKVDKLSGPLSAGLESENSLFALNGQLKNGTLLLNKPFQASLKVTPDLGTHLLKLANPLFLTAFRSEKPVTFMLDARDFALPLFPFTPTKIVLTKGELDLGKLYLQSRTPLTLLLGLFQGGDFGKEVSAVSTPLYFHIENGAMTYERMDTLFGKALHCAFWGKTELPSLKANMFLAVMPDSLAALLALPSPPKAPLIIPFKGTLGDLKADWKKATLSIAALVAKEQGKGGQIVGGVLDIVGKGPKVKVPPPTTTPFPWEN